MPYNTRGDASRWTGRTRKTTMAGTRTTSKQERLEARISPEQKALFQHAAALDGRSVTDFVVSSVQRAAEETIRRHRMMELTARDTEAFAAAMQNPPAPNERLRAAAVRY